MKMNTCINCQAILNDDGTVKYCPQCGSKIEPGQPTSQISHCKKCQTVLDKDAKFCHCCGSKVEDMIQATPTNLKRLSPDTYNTFCNQVNTDTAAKKDCLLTWEKILVWVLVTLIPLGIIGTACVYYSIREKYPKKASELNKHSFIAFGVGILLIILLNSCEADIEGFE